MDDITAIPYKCSMSTAAQILHPDLYDSDFHAWCMEQSALLRSRPPGENDRLDYANLAEEIETLGRSQRSKIKSHMVVLLMHLLKWRHQPGHRCTSWENSIYNAREEIADELRDSPSLKSYAQAVIAEAYPRAVRRAEDETGIARADFPSACPFSAVDVFDPEFLPPSVED